MKRSIAGVVGRYPFSPVSSLSGFRSRPYPHFPLAHAIPFTFAVDVASFLQPVDNAGDCAGRQARFPGQFAGGGVLPEMHEVQALEVAAVEPGTLCDSVAEEDALRRQPAELLLEHA